MSKRPIAELLGDDVEAAKKAKVYEHVNKHTLDSEEEDSDVEESRFNVLDEEDIHGEEDGISRMEGEAKITPFNMKEELEEGHFDGDGHFHWNKDNEIKDHWLDNIDWVKIKQQDESKYLLEAGGSSGATGGLADSSSDSEAETDEFDVIKAYRRILELMQPKETIKRTLQRLGKKSAKISSIERVRNKKAGIIDEDAKLVTELTELCNKILTKLGNMDIYEETFEHINGKFSSKLKGSGKPIVGDDELDMYADDFDTKEKGKIIGTEPSGSGSGSGSGNATNDESTTDSGVKWEYKMKPNDTKMHGPFTTEQMQKWVDEGYFKEPVQVRKAGSDSQFYSSNRVDFELYL